MRHAGLACLAAAALLVGCGGGSSADDVPDNAVAKVGDTVITRAQFSDRLRRVRIPRTEMKGRRRADAYDPPDYKACIASKRRQPVPSGHERPSDEDLKKECEDEFGKIKDRAMEAVIGEEWIRQEAKARGIEFSEQRASRAFDQLLKREGVEKKREYRTFLRESGQTRRDVLRDIRNDVLEGDLADDVMATAPKVTDADVERYYASHRKELGEPERRDVKLVLAKNEAQANAAKRAVEDGSSWPAVAKRYSIDPDSKKSGGTITGLTNGQLGEDELDKALFAAPEGTLEGPVEGQFGWFVFEVTQIHEPSGRSLEEARADIRKRLREERRQKVLDAFNQRFQQKYEAMTVCADGFEVPDCSNG